MSVQRPDKKQQRYINIHVLKNSYKRYVSRRGKWPSMIICFFFTKRLQNNITYLNGFHLSSLE